MIEPPTQGDEGLWRPVDELPTMVPSCSVYDGGFIEWSADRRLPLELGDPPDAVDDSTANSTQQTDGNPSA